MTRAPKVAYLSAMWDAPYPLQEIFTAYQSALLNDNGVGVELGFHPNVAGLTAALPNGSVAQVKQALASVLSIGKPTVTTLDENWGDVFAGFQGPPADQPGNASVVSLFASKPFPKQAIDVVNEFVLGGSPPPTNESNYQVGGFGGAVKRSAPPGGTARANSDEQLQTVAMAWTSEFSQALRQSVDQELGAYVNVPDAGLPDWETAYWGSNVDRLRRIKAKYDPDNIFQYEQSIPPATS